MLKITQRMFRLESIHKKKVIREKLRMIAYFFFRFGTIGNGIPKNDAKRRDVLIFFKSFSCRNSPIFFNYQTSLEFPSKKKKRLSNSFTLHNILFKKK